MVARIENVMVENIDAYTKHAKRAAIEGLDSVYVTGRGFNIDFTISVINAIKTKKRVTHMWTKKYTYANRRGTTVILALFRNLFVHPTNAQR